LELKKNEQEKEFKSVYISAEQPTKYPVDLLQTELKKSSLLKLIFRKKDGDINISEPFEFNKIDENNCYN